MLHGTELSYGPLYAKEAKNVDRFSRVFGIPIKNKGPI